MMSPRRVLPLLLFAFAASSCGGETAPSTGKVDPVVALWSKGPMFPFEAGTRWTYAARMGDRTWEVRAKRMGGDVREREGRQVRYDFTYADLGDEIPDAMKSIHAMPAEGPEEFYVDAFHFSVHHKPPVPLLPTEPKTGARWTWTGGFAIEPWIDEQRELTSTLEVVGTEVLETKAGAFEAVRIDETHEDLTIARWFAPKVGMVRLEVSGAIDGKPVAFAMQLTSFQTP